MNEKKLPEIVTFLLDIFTVTDDYGVRKIKKGTTITSAIAAAALVVGFSTGFISEESMKCMYDASQEIEAEVRADDA